jgi:hypothetical protein
VEFRRLGTSGFNVPVLSFGAGTFGEKGELFQAWGSSGEVEARRLVDICLMPASICSIRRTFLLRRLGRGAWEREVTPAYPYWHQRQFAERNPPPV